MERLPSLSESSRRVAGRRGGGAGPVTKTTWAPRSGSRTAANRGRPEPAQLHEAQPPQRADPLRHDPNVDRPAGPSQDQFTSTVTRQGSTGVDHPHEAARRPPRAGGRPGPRRRTRFAESRLRPDRDLCPSGHHSRRLRGMSTNVTHEPTAPTGESAPVARWRVWTIRIGYALLPLWVLSMPQSAAPIGQADPGSATTRSPSSLSRPHPRPSPAEPSRDRSGEDRPVHHPPMTGTNRGQVRPGLARSWGQMTVRRPIHAAARVTNAAANGFRCWVAIPGV